MNLRITVPRLVDVALIDDLAAMQWLNRHPDVSRRLPPTGYLLHELLRRRIERDLGASGGPLPIFLAREELVRRERQQRLEERLAAMSPSDAVHADGVDRLARHVAGERDGEVALLVQQMVGRWFSDAYSASAGTVRAARLLESWPRRDPVSAALLRVTGALRRARGRLARAAEHDPSGVHATSLALFNLVEAVENLTRRARSGAPAAEPAAAVAASLVAPKLVFRACHRDIEVDFVRGPLRRGTLIVFPLRRIQRRSGSSEPVFHASEWSRCPAHAVIPRFLEAIWREAARRRAGPAGSAEPRTGRASA